MLERSWDRELCRASRSAHTASRAHAIVKVRSGQQERTNDCKYPVRRQTEIGVRDRCANNKCEHANDAGGHYSKAPVPPETKPQRHCTQWQYYDEHLRMQVTFGELRKEWQACNNKWQGQAVD